MEKILFIDESGDHSLRKMDKNYPVFVLGGAIFEKTYALKTLKEMVNEFKLDLFNDNSIILRTSDISRNQNGFEILKDSAFRDKFYKKINSLMSNLDYKAVACVIDKPQHAKAYGNLAFDPYNFSLQILVERFCYDLKKSDQGLIIAESRDKHLDEMLLTEWEQIKLRGTSHIKGSEIRQKIKGLELRKKSLNIEGLQIADLIVSPVGRDYLKKTPREDIKIIKKKMRKNNKGDISGHGLIILPKDKGPATQSPI